MVPAPYPFDESCGSTLSDVAKVRIVPKIAGAPLQISATSYLLYRQCPARANARFQGEYGKTSRPAFVGSLSHQIFRRHLMEGPISEECFAQVCREEIGSSAGLNNSMAELGLKPSNLDGVFAEVRGFYERFLKLSQDGFEGAEIRFEVEPAQGLTVVGLIDAVYLEPDGGHRLVDWKTGDLGEAPIQLEFYGLIWTLSREKIPKQVEAVSVGTGESYRSQPTLESLQVVGQAVASMVDELRDGWNRADEFDRRGGPWCVHCPILKGCREGEATVKLLE